MCSILADVSRSTRCMAPAHRSGAGRGSAAVVLLVTMPVHTVASLAQLWSRRAGGRDRLAPPGVQRLGEADAGAGPPRS